MVAITTSTTPSIWPRRTFSYLGVPARPAYASTKIYLPDPVNSNEIVGFDGMESDISLNEGTVYTGATAKKTYATYTWSFGDGSPEVTGFAPGAPTPASPPKLRSAPSRG